MKRACVFLFLILAVFSFCFLSFASGPTYVGGLLIKDTIWSSENSPYIVSSNVYVSYGKILSITTGTVVRFNENCSLSGGIINAKGDESGRILFTSVSSSPAAGKWEGVNVIIESGLSGFCYADFEFARNALALNTGLSNINLENCRFSNNITGLNIFGGKNLYITSCTFVSNTQGIQGNAENIKILFGTFLNNSFGLSEVNNAAVELCNFHNNGTGIFNVTGSIKLSIFGSNHTAVKSTAGVLSEVKGNTISSNQEGAVLYRTPINGFSFNNISNNTNFGFSSDSSIFEIIASYNWWGTTDTKLIDLSINDWNDNHSIAPVTYTPYLSSPYVFGITKTNITDLSARISELPGSVEISFKIPFDKDYFSGKYKVQYSNDFNVVWSTVYAQTTGGMFNSLAGKQVTMDIGNLQSDLTYYFCAWLADESGIWNEKSNIAKVCTFSLFQPNTLTVNVAKNSLYNNENTEIAANVTDIFGNPRSNIEVKFEIIAGNGSVSSDNAFTDLNGNGKIYFKAPNQGIGSTRIRVSVNNLAPVEVSINIYMMIQPSGGKVYAPDDNKSYIDLASGSFDRYVIVTMIPYSMPEGMGKGYDLMAKTINKKDLIFLIEPAKVVLHYELDLRGNVENTGVSSFDAGNKIGVFRFDGVNWVPLMSKVDTVNQTVSASINHFSRYAIMENQKPGNFSFLRVSPNPFTPLSSSSFRKAEFYFMNPSNDEVSLKILSLDGSLVRNTSFSYTETPYWDGTNEDGRVVENGIYLYQLKAGSNYHTGTVTLSK